MVMPPGSRAIGGIRLNGNGENVLKLSQLVNSKRSTTSGWRGATSCETAPPGVVADDRRALEPERPDQLGDQLRLARWREISVPVHRDEWEPIGQSGTKRDNATRRSPTANATSSSTTSSEPGSSKPTANGSTSWSGSCGNPPSLRVPRGTPRSTGELPS
jgi:hypothetical protein